MRGLTRCAVLLLVCFAIGSPALAVCPSAPTLLSPANNSVEDFGIVTFTWDEVTGAQT